VTYNKQVGGGDSISFRLTLLCVPIPQMDSSTRHCGVLFDAFASSACVSKTSAVKYHIGL